MKPVWHLLRTQVYQLSQMQHELDEIGKKLDRLTAHRDRDVVCVNVYKSLARGIVQRRKAVKQSPFNSFGSHPGEGE